MSREEKERKDAEKEEERRKKRQERLQKHVVVCPHCGEGALDHMTKCPHCGGELIPAGYRPMSDEKSKRVHRICMIAGVALTVAVFVAIIVLKAEGIL